MGSCVYGQYFNNQVCTPLPQLCNPPLIWNGNSCKANNNNCPLGLYWSNNKCIPYVGCKNGFVWN